MKDYGFEFWTTAPHGFVHLSGSVGSPESVIRFPVKIDDDVIPVLAPSFETAALAAIARKLGYDVEFVRRDPELPITQDSRPDPHATPE